ncbi:MAG: DUF4276 family protein [bacterium]|nr:DUF4276 family protein [bacterium]
MKVWIFVEGDSDRLALGALWEKCGWRSQLRVKGYGLHMVPLENKDKFLRKIGPRAAEKLMGQEGDLVVGMPDFYPNSPYAAGNMRHDTLEELRELQRTAVERSLGEVYAIQGMHLKNRMRRFYPSALKHEMEMLLLAAKDRLGAVIGTSQRLGGWVTPVEEQDQHPSRHPKRIVEELFRTKSPKKKAYRETIHAPAVLGQVTDLRQLLFLENGSVNCPVFKATLEWVGEMAGVPAY